MTTMVSSLVASMPGTTGHEGSSHLRTLRMERRTLCTRVAYVWRQRGNPTFVADPVAGRKLQMNETPVVAQSLGASV